MSQQQHHIDAPNSEQVSEQESLDHVTDEEKLESEPVEEAAREEAGLPPPATEPEKQPTPGPGGFGGPVPNGMSEALFVRTLRITF